MILKPTFRLESESSFKSSKVISEEVSIRTEDRLLKLWFLVNVAVPFNISNMQMISAYPSSPNKKLAMNRTIRIVGGRRSLKLVVYYPFLTRIVVSVPAEDSFQKHYIKSKETSRK